ncbi:MAG: TonB-dependent vitamin B12 receptor [Cycloclasticus sp.]|nr:TonB-dependent vitamin B12 receptor [Cycloclasticus sp.]
MNKCCLFASVILLCVQSTFASEPEPLDIIVTASRTAETTDDTLAAVTVITRDDIERLQAQSVQSVLQGIAGINITNNGGPGKATSVFLRGTESDHVLVLIDGIKVGSATLGTTAFQHIPIEQIERIEIVRGPLSSLYGSEAIGGVIQIFTRKGGGETKPFFSIGAGRYDTYNASVGVSGGGERGWFSLSASGLDTNGFNACNGKPYPGGAGCFTIEPDEDGYNNLSGSLRVGYRFESGIEIDAHALQTTGEIEFDGGFVNESESLQQILGVSVRFSPLDIWQISLVAGSSQDESDNFKDGTFQSRFETERNTASFQNDFSIMDDHLLTLGFDYQKDRVDGTTNYSVTSRDNTGVFTQYLATIGNQDLQLSLRQDDNEQFGHHTTGNVAWGYKLHNGLRLNASYGTAFKAPTFNELYYPGYGNANLEPEESRSIEFGLSGKTGWGSWSSNIYETLIDDLIAYDSSISAPGNIDQARIRGLEVILSTQFKSWNLTTNFTLLDPENDSNGTNQGNVLPRRAEQSMRIDASHKVGKTTLGSTLIAEGRRYDDLANTRELSGYATVDLRAEYVFAKDWLLQARIENLFDKDYETAAFFNQPGRGLYMTLRYQP